MDRERQYQPDYGIEGHDPNARRQTLRGALFALGWIATWVLCFLAGYFLRSHGGT
jgi:hypothetical protein